MFIRFHFKEEKQQILLDSDAFPLPPPHGHTPSTSQSPSSTPEMNERERGGDGEVGSYRLGCKGSVSEAGRKFCFACEALTHRHRHNSECSLTGVRTQSKLLHGYSNCPWSQPVGGAKRDQFCSTCVPNTIPPAPHPPANTRSHKEHKHPVMGTFPSGAKSLSGERKQPKATNMPPINAC